jgi:osmotically-inducible protein OsmY
VIVKGVKRLPVVRADGLLVGFGSRADLISAFIRPDDAIADEVHEEISARVLLTELGQVDAKVANGVVTLSGHLDRKTSVDLTRKIASSVDGVVGVANELTFRWDDSKLA